MMFINIALSQFMEMAKDPKTQTEYNLNQVLKNNIEKNDLSDYILAVLKDDTSSYVSQTRISEASSYFQINKYVLNFLEQNNDNLSKLYSFSPTKYTDSNHTYYFRELFEMNIEPDAFLEIAKKWDILKQPDNFFYAVGAMFYNNSNRKNVPKFLSKNLLSYLTMYKDSNKEDILKVAHMFLLDSKLIPLRNDIINILEDCGDYRSVIKNELHNFYITGKIRNENHLYIPSENIDYLIKTVFDNMTNEEVRNFVDKIKEEKNNHLNKTPYAKLMSYFIERDLIDLFDDKKNKVLLTQAGYLPFNHLENILETIKDNNQLKKQLLSSFIQKCSYQQTLPFLHYIQANNININVDEYKQKIVKGFSEYFYKKDINKVTEIFSSVNKYVNFENNKQIYTNEIFDTLKSNLKKSDMPTILENLNATFLKMESINTEMDFSLINKQSLDKIKGTVLFTGIENYILRNEIIKSSVNEDNQIKKRI